MERSIGRHGEIMEQLSFEMNPASDYTQRWKNRQHSWRHTSEGGFNHLNYEVALIPDDTTAKQFVKEHHYSGSYPSAVHRFGMFEHDHLVGVGVLSVPPQDSVLTSVFPDLLPNSEALELGRLVLLDEVPANAESWFIARMWELAVQEGVRGVVSFSDPIVRTDVEHNVIFPGHVGTIYQASNAEYLGRATPRTLKLLPNGQILHERTLQKIRSQEKGADYSEKILVDFGAHAREEQEEPRTWLREALKEIGIRPLRHTGNHRYAFRLGKNRRSIHIGMTRQPYPKKNNNF